MPTLVSEPLPPRNVSYTTRRRLRGIDLRRQRCWLQRWPIVQRRRHQRWPAWQPGNAACRGRRTDEIDAAIAIHRDRRRSFRAGAAEVRGKIEHWIDDQLAAAVIRANLETDAVGGAQNKASGDRLAAVSIALVNLRRLQAQAAIILCAGEDQIAIAQFQLGRAVKLQFGLRRIGAGSDPEVIFQMALVSIKN